MGDLQSPATEVMSTVNKFPLHSLNRQFVWKLLLQLFRLKQWFGRLKITPTVREDINTLYFYQTVII